MPPLIEYYCPCNSPSHVPPPATLPSSSFRFHPLQALFFCEECDAVRCDSCVAVEVSGYYCPNCLFEVPSASVRAEKNRCARNCFVCPLCENTLSVVPSDPQESNDGRSAAVAVSTVGEPPFFLYCNHCRWDSAEVGITFEKPTGLATQLQKYEDSAPEALEFERLKEHFEPFLRASSSSHVPPTHTPHTNSITAAAASALSRDIPGVARYTPRNLRRDKTANKDEMPEYKSRVDIVNASLSGGGGGDLDIDFLRGLENIEDVTAVEQRWRSSWATPLRSSELRPVRIPLQTKKTKRCGVCKHILIKPEQKAQSVRYKIKLVAANYLPAITLSLPQHRPPPGVARAGAAPPPLLGLQAGKTHAFQLAFTNPLYDPIQVRLTRHVSIGDDQDKARRPPFAITLPNIPFPVAAFAEAWEYDEDEEMDEAEDLVGLRGDVAGGKTVGVLEKKANVTIIGGEVMLGKSAKGDVKFALSVTFTYRSDEPMDEDAAATGTPSRTGKTELKTFSFSTMVDLGPVVPREKEDISAI